MCVGVFDKRTNENLPLIVGISASKWENFLLLESAAKLVIQREGTYLFGTGKTN